MVFSLPFSALLFASYLYNLFFISTLVQCLRRAHQLGLHQQGRAFPLNSSQFLFAANSIITLSSYLFMLNFTISSNFTTIIKKKECFLNLVLVIDHIINCIITPISTTLHYPPLLTHQYFIKQ